MSSVSVVIPAYNAERYLAECLTSVLEQSHRPIEVIVVDDGSTDGTSEIARSSLPRVRYHHQENRGVAGALNAGIALATGDYVSLVASDDGLCPGATAAQAEVLDRYPRAAMVHGGAEHIDESSNVLEREPARDGGVRHQPSRDAVRWLLGSNLVICSSVMIRRSFFERHGGFRQEFVPGEDWELWLRVAAHHDLVYVGRPLARRRTHGESLTAGFTVESVVRSHERVLRSLFSETPLAGHRHLERYAYAANDRTIAGLAARLRQRGDFIRHISLAVRRDPTVLGQRATWQTLIEGGKALLPERALRVVRQMRHARRAIAATE